MANRTTLKNFFRSGALPSAEQFADLIDSSVNKTDDGFEKSPTDGLIISATGGRDGLISFSRSAKPEDILWSISYDKKRDHLLLKSASPTDGETPVLALSRDGGIGINTAAPRRGVDIAGRIQAEGRLGIPTPEKSVPANGRWHDITEELPGCSALEVMAGVGRPGTGRYGMLHAVAMNMHNPGGFLSWLARRKKPIKSQHAYYSAAAYRLQLRWAGNGRTYRLQLRSRCDYHDASEREKIKPTQDEEIHVQYYITKLWFDEGMEHCLEPAKPAGKKA